MRIFRPLLLAAVLLAASLGVHAQADAAPILQEDDPAGDVSVGTTGAAPPAGADSVDLLQVRLLAGTMYAWEVDTAAAFEEGSGTRLEVHYSVGGRAYRVSYPHDCGGARLAIHVPTTGHWRPHSCLDAAVEGATVRISSPSEGFHDARGVPFGAPLSEVWVASVAGPAGIGSPDPARFHDRLPDDGLLGPFAFPSGDAPQGDIHLATDQPVRVSNGLDETILFMVDVTNLGESAAEVALQAQDVPDPWEVTLDPSIRLEAGQTRQIPVLVAVPFQHEHGDMQNFTLVASRVDDPQQRATKDLTVLWHPVAQPSRHHPALYLHDDDGAWLDTSPDETGGTFYMGNPGINGLPTPSTRVQSGFIPLHPPLAVGLDFIINATVEFTFDLVPPTDLDGASARVDMWACDFASPPRDTIRSPVCWDRARDTYHNWTDIFTARSSGMDLAADVANPVTFSFPAQPDTDRIPPTSNMGLYILINLGWKNQAAVGEGEGGIGIPLDSFRLRLPLNEYRDAIPPGMDGQGIGIEGDGGLAMLVNPGGRRVLPVTLHNQADSAAELALDIAGLNAGWARASPERLDVDPQGSAQGFVVIEAPRDASPGERIDAFLRARDGELTGLLHFSAEVVDPDVSRIPDDALPDRTDRSSPALFALLLAGLAVAAYRRR